MNDRLELTEDRLDDLEDQFIQLAQKQKNSRQADCQHLPRIPVVKVMAIPIIIAVFILLGLDINYQSGNKTISYNSKGLLEITLLAITTFSGGYVANKHRNEHFDE